MGEVDVAIVGGGISGLYTAWRLATTTRLKVAVLEYSNRFGGRYQTCIMPGGFAADMGAMRYVPLSHPILHQLIKDMKLPIEKFHQYNGKKNTVKMLYRNQHVTREDIARMYSVTDEERLYSSFFTGPNVLQLPENGNFYRATVKGTAYPARDMTLSHMATLTNNAELLNLNRSIYPTTKTVADTAATLSQHQSADDIRPLAGLSYIIGGMESLIKELVSQLMVKDVMLQLDFPVTRVVQTEDGFEMKSCYNQSIFRCKKIFLACNARGIDLITWQTRNDLAIHLQQLLSNVRRIAGFKMFMTYEEAWWERYGLIDGTVQTDLPVERVIAFGDRGTKNGYSTILASLSYNHNEIFEGLNLPNAERFQNKVGDVPRDLQPSRRMVDYVQQQLASLFGCQVDDIPPPVCAASRLWNSDPIETAIFEVRVGVDSNMLNWRSLKPFDDMEIYIGGDTFSACNRIGCYMGWTEGALLTSERILTNHFNIYPYIDGISLSNDWPED